MPAPGHKVGVGSLELVLQSQQRVERLLREFAEAQRSTESALNKMQRHLCSSEWPEQCDGCYPSKAMGWQIQRAVRPVTPQSPSGLSLTGSSKANTEKAAEDIHASKGASGGGADITLGDSESDVDISCSDRTGTRFRHVKRRLPDYEEVFSGDSQEAPAGSKSGKSKMSRHSAGIQTLGYNRALSGIKHPYNRLQDPNSVLQMPWCLCGVLLLIVDLSLTPYVLAWQTPFSDKMAAFFFISAIYWSLDIAANLVVGFYVDGQFITDPREIAMRYLKSSLLPDLLIVCSDWLSMLLLIWSSDHVDDSGGLRLLRFVKLARGMRMVNLLRVFACGRTVSRLLRGILSERVRLLVQVLMTSIMMLWLNHVIACIWYAVGHQGLVSAESHWVDDYHGSFFEEYVVSFHWALAQITLGSIDVVCQNWAERMFNVLCLCIGLIVGTTLISMLSANMVEFHVMNKDRTIKLRNLRQYLRENMISFQTSLVVQQQVSERMDERRHLVEAQVPALEMLSASLHVELRYELVQSYIFSHGLFSYLSSAEVGWCIMFCQTAFVVEALSVKDDLFLTDAPARAAYVLMKGELKYYLGLSESQPSLARMGISRGNTEYAHGFVAPQDWLAEAALFSQWVHVGQAVANDMCQVVVISPDEFEQSLRRWPSAYALVSDYGKQFHRRIVDSVHQHDGDPPTDLAVPCAQWEEILLSMSSELQKSISHAVVDVMDLRAKTSSYKGSSKFFDIREEIDLNKCVMVANPAGTPERLVSVVALHVKRMDGTILAQVGKFKPRAGGFIPTCELPGMKCNVSEPFVDSLQQLLATRMLPIATALKHLRSERLIATEDSKRANMQTKYLRYVYYCNMDERIQAPSCTAAHPDWNIASTRIDLHRLPTREDLARSLRRNVNESSTSPALPLSKQQSAGGLTSGGSLADMDIFRSLDQVGNFRSLFGAGPVRSEPMQQLLLQDFLNREVFFFADEGKGEYYSWVSPQEFEQLRGPSGERLLTSWLGTLGQPPLPPLPAQMEGHEMDVVRTVT